MPKTTLPVVARRRERLKSWIDKHFEGRQVDFIRATKINQGELSGLLKDKSFAEKRARRLEKQAGMPDGYLDADVVLMRTDHSVRAIERPPTNIAGNETNQAYVRFPLLEGYAGMGRGDYVGDYPEIVDFVEVTREWALEKLRGIPPEVVRVITGRGDSMKGQYNDGDLVFVDSRVKTFVADSAYVYRWNGRVQIKRLQLIGSNRVRILSKNPDYQPVDVDLGELEIGGRALAAWTLSQF